MKEIAEEEELTNQPGFWNDPKKAEALLRTINEKKYWTKAYEKVMTAFEELTVINDFYEMGEKG